MFVFVSLILSTTVCVKLKIEFLSGFTDFVVSITKVSGGFKTGAPPAGPDMGQSWHLQATHLKEIQIGFIRLRLNF